MREKCIEKDRDMPMEGKAKMTVNPKNIRIINIACIVMGLIVVLPLLIMGHYNYPSADDWSLAGITHHVIEDGGNLIDILKSIGNSVMVWREKGEPRYASVVFASLQPGVWGEHWYRITPWLMIGGLCISEIMLCAYLLKDAENENRKWILPIMLPSLAIQLLCVPYPVETFYWYTGSVNYTFVFALSIILLILFMQLMKGGMSRRKTVLVCVAAVLLGAIVGGNNYATSLSTVCIFGALSLLLLFRDRKAFWRTLPVTIVTTVGLIICLVAPGNMVRLNDEFGGTTTGAFNAIVMSLVRTGTNIFSWTGLKIVLLMLLIIPFLWKALKRVNYEFRYPVVFTLFTFGIYASQIVATMYVDGTTGGRRMADILYYAYHVWLLLNVGYWLGFVQKREVLARIPLVQKGKTLVGRYILVWFVGVGVLLAGVLGMTELKMLSTYRACAWLAKGYARDYAAAWEERLAVLNDDTVKEVYFDPLPGYEELVFYADFQQGENWINNACEDYYDKDYVGLK